MNDAAAEGATEPAPADPTPTDSGSDAAADGTAEPAAGPPPVGQSDRDACAEAADGTGCEGRSRRRFMERLSRSKRRKGVRRQLVGAIVVKLRRMQRLQPVTVLVRSVGGTELVSIPPSRTCGNLKALLRVGKLARLILKLDGEELDDGCRLYRRGVRSGSVFELAVDVSGGGGGGEPPKKKKKTQGGRGAAEVGAGEHHLYATGAKAGQCRPGCAKCKEEGKVGSTKRSKKGGSGSKKKAKGSVYNKLIPTRPCIRAGIGTPS